MKKKLVKRLLATALVTVMTASMLVGCGGGDGQSSDGAAADIGIRVIWQLMTGLPQKNWK